MQRVYRLTPLILLFLWLTLVGRPLAAQDAITFKSFSTDNHFPQDLTFKATVSSNAGEITGATLIFHLRNEFSSDSLTRGEVAVDPDNQGELIYVWDTSAGTIPGAAVLYYWEVTDSVGNIARSDEMMVRYEDTRFDWQVVENEAVAVWQHGRPDSFGEQVFEIANQALDSQHDLFQADLDFQIRILIYNTFEEFAEWNGVVSEFVGGQAFPNQGITAQIVSAYGSQERWLNDVVPHEISHLYFSQVTFNRRSTPPTWLNEGLAQFNEFGSQRDALRQTERAAKNGELLSLSRLEYGFGFSNETRTRLAYAEAVSAVTYLVEAYGEKGLANLLAAYKQGLVTDEAFPDALGITPGEFEGSWSVWLGLEPGEHVTPTPWPLPTFPASPTPVVLGTAVPEEMNMTAVASPTPLPLIETPQPNLTITPTPPEQENELTGYNPMWSVLTICLISLCCGLVIVLVGIAIWQVWKRTAVRGN